MRSKHNDRSSGSRVFGGCNRPQQQGSALVPNELLRSAEPARPAGSEYQAPKAFR
jgi:hypothetical protein